MARSQPWQSRLPSVQAGTDADGSFPSHTPDLFSDRKFYLLHSSVLISSAEWAPKEGAKHSTPGFLIRKFRGPKLSVLLFNLKKDGETGAVLLGSAPLSFELPKLLTREIFSSSRVICLG